MTTHGLWQRVRQELLASPDQSVQGALEWYRRQPQGRDLDGVELRADNIDQLANEIVGYRLSKPGVRG